MQIMIVIIGDCIDASIYAIRKGLMNDANRCFYLVKDFFVKLSESFQDNLLATANL